MPFLHRASIKPLSNCPVFAPSRLQMVALYQHLVADANEKMKKESLMTGALMGYAQFSIYAVYGLIIWFGGLDIDQGRTDFDSMLKVRVCVFARACVCIFTLAFTCWRLRQQPFFLQKKLVLKFTHASQRPKDLHFPIPNFVLTHELVPFLSSGCATRCSAVSEDITGNHQDPDQLSTFGGPMFLNTSGLHSFNTHRPSWQS